jgi:hypothetical protein
MSKRDITPRPKIIAGTREQSLGFVPALCEFIDNSFGAGANKVTITIPTKLGQPIRVRDDGDGVQSLVNMFRFGDSTPSGKHVRVGRWGVGFKEAAIWLGDRVSVSSIRGRKQHHVIVDWSVLETQDKWEIDEPQSDDIEAAAESGTVITISRPCYHHVKRTQKAIDDLIKKLGITYHPILAKGGQIIIMHGSRKIRVQPFEWPELDGDPIARKLRINGKTAKVKVGILQAGVNTPFEGIQYCHHYRVIERSCAVATNNGYPGQGLVGIVELSDKWVVGKNKMRITDKDFPALNDRLFTLLRPFLKTLQERAQHVASESLRQGASELMSKAAQKAKRRKRPKNQQSLEAISKDVKEGTGSSHENAQKTQNKAGNIHNSDVIRQAIHIHFTPQDDIYLGEVDLPANVVRLYEKHKVVEALQQMPDDCGRCRELRKVALAGIASALYVNQILQGSEREQERHISGLTSDGESWEKLSLGMDKFLAGMDFSGIVKEN